MNFVEVRPQTQFRASKLIGTRVTGANNESIGEINDVLMDQSGRAHAVIIGVGGFLGIGEKDVAIPMTAIQFSAGNVDMAQRGATTTGAVTAPAAPTTTSAPYRQTTTQTCPPMLQQRAQRLRPPARRWLTWMTACRTGLCCR